jgi:hypothetical protein
MPSPKRRAPPREVPLAELEAAVREALATGAGITPTALKKALPKSYKKPEHNRALEILRALAARDEIHRWSKAKKEIFFSRDPIATLDSVVVESLAKNQLTAAALKSAVNARAPGHEDLLTEWLKHAVARGVLFKQGSSYSCEPAVPPAEIEAAVRDALASGAGITLASLKQALPKSCKKPELDRAIALLRELADRDEIHRLSIRNKEFFFARDPIATLDSVVVEALASGPLTGAALTTAVQERAPGHDVLLGEWLKNALARRVLFGQGKGKSKSYSREPDIRGLLKNEIQALKKALQKIESQGIDRARIAEVLLEALALRAAPTTNGTPPTARFLIALNDLAAENPRGALLSLRDLRARLSMSKDEFDETALRLQQEGAVSLHHHDHPLALSEAERAALVRDRSAGEHYVGIALKEQEGP